jgi:hypothetical protein
MNAGQIKVPDEIMESHRLPAAYLRKQFINAGLLPQHKELTRSKDFTETIDDVGMEALKACNEKGMDFGFYRDEKNKCRIYSWFPMPAGQFELMGYKCLNKG